MLDIFGGDFRTSSSFRAMVFPCPAELCDRVFVQQLQQQHHQQQQQEEQAAVATAAAAANFCKDFLFCF